MTIVIMMRSVSGGEQGRDADYNICAGPTIVIIMIMTSFMKRGGGKAVSILLHCQLLDKHHNLK